MAESDVAGRLKSFVSSLKNQGTLDECYDALVKLKMVLSSVPLGNHNIVLQGERYHNIRNPASWFVNTSFLIVQLLNYLIEYSKVVSNAHKLKGSSARSIDAFSKMKCEYEVLCESLGHQSGWSRVSSL